MIWNTGVSDRKALLRGLLSWAWQVLAVLTLSLCLIWWGTRLPSVQPSVVVPEQVPLSVCIVDADGLIAQCRTSAYVHPST